MSIRTATATPTATPIIPINFHHSFSPSPPPFANPLSAAPNDPRSLPSGPFLLPRFGGCVDEFAPPAHSDCRAGQPLAFRRWHWGFMLFVCSMRFGFSIKNCYAMKASWRRRLGLRLCEPCTFSSKRIGFSPWMRSRAEKRPERSIIGRSKTPGNGRKAERPLRFTKLVYGRPWRFSRVKSVRDWKYLASSPARIAYGLELTPPRSSSAAFPCGNAARRRPGIAEPCRLPRSFNLLKGFAMKTLCGFFLAMLMAMSSTVFAQETLTVSFKTTTGQRLVCPEKHRGGLDFQGFG